MYSVSLVLAQCSFTQKKKKRRKRKNVNIDIRIFYNEAQCQDTHRFETSEGQTPNIDIRMSS